MKCFEIPHKEKSKFTYPEEMEKIFRYFDAHDIKVNIDLMTVEKLWYGFSEGRCATFLIPDDELISEFLEWASKIDVEEADRMNYYAVLMDKPYRPWEDADEDDD